MTEVTASERAVIGGLCIDLRCLPEVEGILTPEDFSNPTFAKVYAEACNDPTFDNVSAINMLAADFGEAEAGQFIIECMELCPSVAQVPYHARQVQKAARARRLREAVYAALDEAADADELADRLAGAAQAALSEINGGDGVPLVRALADFMTDLEHGESERIDTGFHRLDAIIKGLRPGQLILLGARPSVGKSAFSAAVALNVASESKKVLLFSLEMTEREISQRYVARSSGLPVSTFLDGVHDELTMRRIGEACGELSRSSLVIYDTPSMTAGKLRARVRQHPDAKLVIVDYLGLMQISRKDGNRNLELGELSRSLKVLAGETGIPIIALSQLNRGTDAAERPGLRSLRDSGELEQHADKVLLMWRPEPGMVAVDVAKNRNGETGVVLFSFDGARMTFRESAREYTEPSRHGKRGFLEA